MAEVLAPFSRGRFHSDWRVGLAAGFDRDGRQLAALSEAGFGFVELGTVGIVDGADRFDAVRRMASRLADSAASRWRMAVGVSVSASSDADFPRRILPEVLGLCVKLLASHADFITFNLTAGPGATLLESCHRATLRAMLGEASAARSRTPLRPLLFAKLQHRSVVAGNHVIEELMRADFDGVVLAAERKGEGQVPEAEALWTLAELARRVDGRLTIVAVGGAADVQRIRARLGCGADLVQVHRAFHQGGSAWLKHVREQCSAGWESEALRLEILRGAAAGNTSKELSVVLHPPGAGPS